MPRPKTSSRAKKELKALRQARYLLKRERSVANRIEHAETQAENAAARAAALKGEEEPEAASSESAPLLDGAALLRGILAIAEDQHKQTRRLHGIKLMLATIQHAISESNPNFDFGADMESMEAALPYPERPEPPLRGIVALAESVMRDAPDPADNSKWTPPPAPIKRQREPMRYIDLWPRALYESTEIVPLKSVLASGIQEKFFPRRGLGDNYRYIGLGLWRFSPEDQAALRELLAFYSIELTETLAQTEAPDARWNPWDQVDSGDAWHEKVRIEKLPCEV